MHSTIIIIIIIIILILLYYFIFRNSKTSGGAKTMSQKQRELHDELEHLKKELLEKISETNKIKYRRDRLKSRIRYIPSVLEKIENELKISEKEAVEIFRKIKFLEAEINGLAILDSQIASLTFDDAENYFVKSQLNDKDVQIISKYLDPKTFCIIPRTTKKFLDVPSNYTYNPIPLTNEHQMETFPKMEVIYLYSPNADEVNFALKAMKINKNIKQIIVPNCTYSEYLKYIAQGINPQDILSVILTRSDIIKCCLGDNIDPAFKAKFDHSLLRLGMKNDIRVLDEITIPDCVTHIKTQCFFGMEYCTIHIPATVIYISDYIADAILRYDVDPLNPYYYVDENRNLREK